MVLSGKWIIVENIRLNEVSQTLTLIACFMHMWNKDCFFDRRYNARRKNTEKKRETLEAENGEKRFKSVKYDQMT